MALGFRRYIRCLLDAKRGVEEEQAPGVLLFIIIIIITFHDYYFSFDRVGRRALPFSTKSEQSEECFCIDRKEGGGGGGGGCDP